MCISRSRRRHRRRFRGSHRPRRIRLGNKRGALFANLQATAAQTANLDPRILLAANTIGGGLGKIVSPQNLAVVTTAVQAPGKDAEILKKAAPFSLGLLVLLGALVFVAAQGWLGAYMPA